MPVDCRGHRQLVLQHNPKRLVHHRCHPLRAVRLQQPHHVGGFAVDLQRPLCGLQRSRRRRRLASLRLIRRNGVQKFGKAGSREHCAPCQTAEGRNQKLAAGELLIHFTIASYTPTANRGILHGKTTFYTPERPRPKPANVPASHLINALCQGTAFSRAVCES